MKKLFILAFFIVFLICSKSFIPSVQSSMLKEDIEGKVNTLKNIFDKFRSFIVLWLISAIPITIIHLLIILINGVSISIEEVFGLYYFYLVAPYFIFKLISNFNNITWDYIDDYLIPGFFYYFFIGFLEIVFILRGLKNWE